MARSASTAATSPQNGIAESKVLFAGVKEQLTSSCEIATSCPFPTLNARIVLFPRDPSWYTLFDLMPSITDTFKWGDLIYGIEDARNQYKRHYLRNKFMEFATIDEYHRTMIPMPASGKEPEEFSPPQKRDRMTLHLLMQQQNLPKVSGHLGKEDAKQAKARDDRMLTGLPPQGLTHVGYWDAISQTKYSPARVTGLGLDPGNYAKLQKQTGKEIRQGEDNTATLKEMEYYLAIRRSCKYGLEYVCMTTASTVQIHFALDGIDIRKITGKELDTGRSYITGSELRFAYRKWADFKGTGKILFYIEGTVVSAPWEAKTPEDAALAGKVPGYANEALWQDYERTRAAKTK